VARISPMMRCRCSSALLALLDATAPPLPPPSDDDSPAPTAADDAAVAPSAAPPSPAAPAAAPAPTPPLAVGGGGPASSSESTSEKSSIARPVPVNSACLLRSIFAAAAARVARWSAMSVSLDCDGCHGGL